MDINVGIDRNQIGRLSGSLTKAMAGISDSASSAGSSLGALASRGPALAAAIAAALAPATALIAGLLAGLPSLAAGFGATAGAIALGLDGIKKSAETLKPAVRRTQSVGVRCIRAAVYPDLRSAQVGVPGAGYGHEVRR
ncbi:hypothetical protein QN239_25675 [Mycolicibacterium sp. Y3]